MKTHSLLEGIGTVLGTLGAGALVWNGLHSRDPAHVGAGALIGAGFLARGFLRVEGGLSGFGARANPRGAPAAPTSIGRRLQRESERAAATHSEAARASPLVAHARTPVSASQGPYRLTGAVDVALFVEVDERDSRESIRLTWIGIAIWLFCMAFSLDLVQSHPLDGTRTLAGTALLLSSACLLLEPMIFLWTVGEQRLRSRVEKARIAPIGDLAPGELAQLRGRIAPGKQGTVRALQTDVPCVWTRTRIVDGEGTWESIDLQAFVDFLLLDEKGRIVARVAADDRTEWRVREETVRCDEIHELPRLQDFLISRQLYLDRLAITTNPWEVRTFERHLKPGDEVVVTGEVVRSGPDLVLTGTDGPLIVATGAPYRVGAVALYGAGLFMSVAALAAIAAVLLGYWASGSMPSLGAL